MSTNKERLIAALQEPLETTLTRYKTHLDGLKEDQVEENRDLYGENVITKGQEDSIIKKIYESIWFPLSPMSGLLNQVKKIQRLLSLSSLWFSYLVASVLFKNFVVTRLLAICLA